MDGDLRRGAAVSFRAPLPRPPAAPPDGEVVCPGRGGGRRPEHTRTPGPRSRAVGRAVETRRPEGKLRAFYTPGRESRYDRHEVPWTGGFQDVHPIGEEELRCWRH